MATHLVLLIVLQSLSMGIGHVPDDCTDALRALTANPFERAAITSVVELSPRIKVIDETFAQPELVARTAATGLAYTVEGPRNEVAVVVCAPAELGPVGSPRATSGPGGGS